MIRYLALAACTTCLVPLGSAAAQMSVTPATDHPTSSGDGADQATGLSDIVVTAQRRAEPLQRVPLAISAISGQTIQDDHIAVFSDIAKIAPGFVSGANYGYIRYSSIRGISNNQFGFADDPSIAMYVDGVYQGRGSTGMQTNAFFDLDRVEVVKGPQATLFGRSSIGGAISVVTKQPVLDTLSVEGSLGFGNYGRIVGQAAINVPLAPQLALRVSGDTENHDAYYPNISGAGGLGSNDVKAIRAQLLFNNDSGLTISLKGSAERRRGNAYPIQTTDQPAFQVNLSIGGRNSPSNFDIYEAVNKISYEFSPVVTASVTTSARQVKNTFSLDYDARPAIVGGPYTQKTDDRQVQQDYLVVLTGSKLSGSLGASWFDEKLDGFVSNYVNSTLAFTGAYPTTAAPFDYSAAFYEAGSLNGRFRGYSVFGDATYSITDRLRLTGGARFNSDTKRYTQDIPNPAVLPENTGKAFAGAYYNWGYWTSSPITSEKTWRDLAFRASLSFDILPTLTSYVSYNEGWKAGGIDTFRASTPGPFNFYFGQDVTAAGGKPQVYNPEHSQSYEAGLKGRFFGNRLSANLAIFDYEYRDLQVAVSRGPTVVVANVGSASGRGGELEIRVVPFTGLELFSNNAYTFTKINDFPDIPAQVGLPLNIAPRWSGSSGGTVHLARIVPGDLSVTVDASYRSSYRIDNSPQNLVDGFVLANARINYYTPSGRYGVGLFVENAFNRFTYSSAGLRQAFSASPSNTRSVFGDPRTYGADFHVRF